MSYHSSSREVCYVLAYRAPSYIRTMSLLRALEQLDGIRVLKAVNRTPGLLRYCDTLWKVLMVRLKYNPDCYILGFRGHEIFWPVKLLTIGKPIVFDSLISPYSVIHDERKAGLPGLIISKCVYYLEKSILRHSDKILTDTHLHAEYLLDTFKLSPDKVHVLPVGAVEDIATPKHQESSKPLEVLFYGSFLPLHGIQIMLDAAEKLRDKPIHFTFIGGKGRSLDAFRKSVETLKLENVTHIPWVSFQDLIDIYIPRSDINLGGPFGNTPQARRVITGKTSQSLAMAKATIVGSTKELAGFVDKQNCLLVNQGDSAALAGAIAWASDHKDKLLAIGMNGLALYNERLSVFRVGEVLNEVLQQC